MTYFKVNTNTRKHRPCFRSLLALRSCSADFFLPPRAFFSTVLRRSKLRSLALTSRKTVFRFTRCSRRFASRSFFSISNLIHTRNKYYICLVYRHCHEISLKTCLKTIKRKRLKCARIMLWHGLSEFMEFVQ